MKSLSHAQLFATPRTVAYQAPLSMGFSRQEYWSGLPFPSLPFNGNRSNLTAPLHLVQDDFEDVATRFYLSRTDSAK